MDLSLILQGVDLGEIENHVKEIISLVKEENKKVVLLPGENNVVIQLDIKKDDIIAYRVTTGTITINDKQFVEVKRTIGKWNLNDLNKLIGDNESVPILGTLKKFLPIMEGYLSLTKFHGNEKRVLLQVKITDTEIIAYQIIVAVEKIGEENKLYVSRVLGKYNLKDYLK